MRFQRLIPLAALACLSSITVAKECRLTNLISSNNGPIEKNDHLCKPQGEGDWTFSMMTEMINISPPGTPPGGGNTKGREFYIYDNACKMRGQYKFPECGRPFVIREDFLKKDLEITVVHTNLGDPSFTFRYGEGKHEVGKNQCVCKSRGKGIPTKDCKCAFPLDGHKKRGVLETEEDTGLVTRMVSVPFDV